jgi:basic membrane lipoprotein Med (substrate-binding protein (PBP1-ABC) superfamily)
VRVIVAYRDNGSREKLFLDPDWGRENAQDLIRNGADVLFAAGGETAVGALRAAVEGKVRVIGAERDQEAALGEYGLGVVTSVLGRTSSTVEDLMRRIREGNLADADGSPVGYVSFEASVPKSVSDEMADLLTGLITGEIKTNVTKIKP